MLKLTHRWANALMDYAQEHGLDKIYRQALVFVLCGDFRVEEASDELREFLVKIPEGSAAIPSIMFAFLDIARKRMDLVKTTVISAVQLTSAQLDKLEKKLMGMFRKQLEITAIVDPSLLGGLRVIVGDTVLDDTIKRKLMDMKNDIYNAF